MANPTLVLGGTGMVGQAVVKQFAKSGRGFRATTRHLDLVSAAQRDSFVSFDSATDDPAAMVRGFGPEDAVVNCAALIKTHIVDTDIASRRAAVAANILVQHDFAALAETQGFRIINLTTDCVFAGTRGGYLETDLHNAEDVYGRSKSLGEVPGKTILNLRTSVIGPEIRGFGSLLQWVLGHEAGATISGFADHWWNGVTTPALARVIDAILAHSPTLAGTVHLVPADTANKHELAKMILAAFERGDVSVISTETGANLDRTLGTVDAARNAELWVNAGYAEPPTIAQMVNELNSATNETEPST